MYNIPDDKDKDKERQIFVTILAINTILIVLAMLIYYGGNL